jgi:CRISPR-associated protein Cmr5
MQTRDQKYALDVYQRVSQVKKEDRDSYGSMAHKLPILIRTSGLAQALTYVESRGNAAQKQLLSDLAATLQTPNLATAAITAQLPDYMYLTQQAMAALLWYKRFAQSVLDVDISVTTTQVGGESQ